MEGESVEFHSDVSFKVVRLLGVCTRERPLFMLMEYMSRGSLKEVLRMARPVDNVAEFFPFELARMCCDIASGMTFLSSRNFVHRDLASRCGHI